MLKAGIISLGCAKNLVDTEIMLGMLAAADITITDDPAVADILIVNTCSFIDSAKDESISTILQMAEYKKSGNCRGVIVAGCLSQRYQQQLLDELPEIDAVIGTGAWHRIIEAIETVTAGERALFIGATDTIYDETMPRITTTPRHSCYVKIADGCNNCCSYCVIPLVRGQFRSRPIESVVNEVKLLVSQGTKEINLIAQDTTSYGKDLYGSPRLTELLQQLVTIDGVVWIRLLYCYPNYFTDELIQLMASEPKICNYVDLPLQHAHDTILQAMHRHDSRADIERLLTKIRNAIPDVAIRTSFIVGFPGETEEHFAALQDFLSAQKFDHVGVFTYSQEDDTIAAALPNQVPEEIKQERFHALMALQARISEDRNIAVEGSKLEVLIEGRSDGEQEEIAYGRSYREAPDVDGRVFVENAADAESGDILKVKVVQGFTYDLLTEKL
ncbi:MAG: 30S ribosomal protein S12 methylthiotransferase RimO [Negativicutes bacterium]|nr:30S ribosomal protein S12 methylthiotransferase RimO [Negativicutes bacterium]